MAEPSNAPRPSSVAETKGWGVVGDCCALANNEEAARAKPTAMRVRRGTLVKRQLVVSA